MGIKTVPQPPYSPDLDPGDFWLFSKLKEKLRGCRYETSEEMKKGCEEGHWHVHTWELPWGLPEVVVTVQQMHCSQKRLLRRGLEFHAYTINESAHTKKGLETYWRHLIYIYIYIYRERERERGVILTASQPTYVILGLQVNKSFIVRSY